MPGYVSILLWKTGMFNTQFGLLNQWMEKLGQETVRWLSNDVSAFICCTVVNLWLALPFMIMIMDGAMQSIDRSYFESAILDDATDQWGIKVGRVELRNIIPPREIQEAMEKQMKAERDRRETLLQAEGHKAAVITRAEGEKQAAILRADAKKQQHILEAEGQAEAILKVQTATAEGIRLINESCPSEAVLKLKALEAFSAAADGKATKIIIPSEIQGIAGHAAGLVESVKTEDAKE